MDEDAEGEDDADAEGDEDEENSADPEDKELYCYCQKMSYGEVRLSSLYPRRRLLAHIPILLEKISFRSIISCCVLCGSFAFTAPDFARGETSWFGIWTERAASSPFFLSQMALPVTLPRVRDRFVRF